MLNWARLRLRPVPEAMAQQVEREALAVPARSVESAEWEEQTYLQV